MVEEINRDFPDATPRQIRDAISGYGTIKEGTTTKEYRAVQEFIAKAWERYHSKGMKGFYGSPTEGSLGIVGGVAKALVKELTGQQGEIVETKVKLDGKRTKMAHIILPLKKTVV